MTFLPLALSASASSAENTISPEAAPGEAGKPGGDHLALDSGIDGGVQELIEPAGLDAGDRLLARDQAFIGKLDRNLAARLWRCACRSASAASRACPARR